MIKVFVALLYYGFLMLTSSTNFIEVAINIIYSQKTSILKIKINQGF